MSTAQFAEMTAEQAVAFMADAPKQPARTRLAEMVAGRSVIDIGCGKAEETDLYKPDDYLGIDCSPELIAIARERWPGYRFDVLDGRELMPGWADVAIMKAVLEHLPTPEAMGVYESARRAVDVLYIAWHTEPGEERLTTYPGELGLMEQNRHDRTLFHGVENRQVVGEHVIWTVR